MTARHVLTVLAVADVDRSVAFYDAAFGWPIAVRVAVYAEMTTVGGPRVGLYQRDGFARNTGIAPTLAPPGGIAPGELYFHVDDLTVAVQRLLHAGARELSPSAPRDWGDEAAYFADPDGHVLVVARPLPSS